MNTPLPHLRPMLAGWRRRLLALPLLAFSLFALAPAWAADDPPGRVGRLARASGPVWIYDAEKRDWLETVVNQPLTSGDRLSVGSDARAVVQIGSTTVRLDHASELEFQRIDDAKVVLQLHNGSVGVQVVAAEVVPEIEFLTNEAYVFPRRTGHYRLDRRDGVTQVGVWNGEASVAGPGLNQTVSRGQRLEVWQQGPGLRTAWHSTEADDFSDWVVKSQDEAARSVARNYVSPEMTGWDDLDRHGRWDTHSDYGAIWYPSVSIDWAPFRYGRWTWVRPWGWTWIDAAPWGFAPFHYGRWIQIGGRWCWSPGVRVVRPIYAPAMVSWPGGIDISIRIGNGPPRGWIPLSPYEPYRPYYRSTHNHTTIINQTHVHIHKDRDGRRDWRDEDHRRPRRDGDEVGTRYRNAPVTEAVIPVQDRFGQPTRNLRDDAARNERRNERDDERRNADRREPRSEERIERRDEGRDTRRGTARDTEPGRRPPALTEAVGTPPQTSTPPTLNATPPTAATVPSAAPAAPPQSVYTPAPRSREREDRDEERAAQREARERQYDMREPRQNPRFGERPARREIETQDEGARPQRIDPRGQPAFERERSPAPQVYQSAPTPSPHIRQSAPTVQPAPMPTMQQVPRSERRRNDDDEDRDKKRGRGGRELER